MKSAANVSPNQSGNDEMSTEEQSQIAQDELVKNNAQLMELKNESISLKQNLRMQLDQYKASIDSQLTQLQNAIDTGFEQLHAQLDDK